jgi:hypothetical protein
MVGLDVQEEFCCLLSIVIIVQATVTCEGCCGVSL